MLTILQKIEKKFILNFVNNYYLIIFEIATNLISVWCKILIFDKTNFYIKFSSILQSIYNKFDSKILKMK